MLLRCNYYSPVLYRNTDINIIIPTPHSDGGALQTEYKVLYLLHGLHGDANSWLYRSNIERYANDTGIIVVMPAVNNSFYQDMAYGEKFFTYLTKELPEYIQTLFPVSKKREDTFIAGLSMGGYGAWYLGLKCPEQYAAAASLSGFLDAGFRVTPPPIPAGVDLSAVSAAELSRMIPPFMFHAFGDVTKLAGSDRDIFTLFEQDKAASTLPRLYQSCGTRDYLHPMNRLVNRRLTEMGAEIAYREIPDMEHEWDCWDLEIQNVLKWVLEK